MSESLQRLRELAQLLDSGHLSRKEFERAKQRVLTADTDPMTDEAHADLPRRIGSYELLDFIGEGGMGRVFRARHRSESVATGQGGQVALKILHAQQARNPIVRRRFEQEAELGITLQHPGIVRTFEMIIDEGHVGLVMELVQGEPLGITLQARGAWPWSEARPLLSQLMEAVAYAHGEGVTHRDLKPDNVIVQPSGKIKILDFGIAKSANMNLTQTGYGLGTADYMAPEQFTNAKSVDGRADIYSLGIILYQMLVGRMPWDPGLDATQIFHLKNTGQLPPPSHYRPSISQELESMVLCMLAAKADKRFADMNALRATVAAIDHMVGSPILTAPGGPVTQPIRPPPPPPAKNWSLTFGVAAILVFFLGVVTVGIAVYLKLAEMDAEESNATQDEILEDEEASAEDQEDEELTARDRSQYKIRIRTDSPDDVHELARALRTLGYKVRTQTQPPESWSIQWNSAPDAMIDEIIDAVSQHLDARSEDFERIDSFDANARDIVLNIRFKLNAQEIRDRHEIVLHSNQPDRLHLLVLTLEAWGYRARVMEDEVSMHAIEWGSAPIWITEEVLGIVSEDINIPMEEFVRRNSPQDEDSQVVLHLPFEGG